MKPGRPKLTPIFQVAVCLVVLTALGLKSEAGLEEKPLPRLPPGVKALQSDGLHNLFSLSPNLYSGSAPEGDLGFASLNKLGIKTILTVDGTAPDVSAAHRHGLRYIHIPHGYDGIDAQTQAWLIKAVEILPFRPS